MWKRKNFSNFLTLEEGMTSYGASGGTDVHPLAADRAEDWSPGEPVFLPPWLQNHSPGGPFVAVLDFLRLVLSTLPSSCSSLKHSKLSFLLLQILLCVFITLCGSVFISENILDCLAICLRLAKSLHWLLSSLSSFHSCLNPAVLSLRKEKPLCKTQSLRCLWLDCHAC